MRTDAGPLVEEPAVDVEDLDAAVPAVRDEDTRRRSANRDAVRKLYRYVIHDGRVLSPFMRRYACQSRHKLDDRAMARGAEALKGRHDFHSFETDWPNRMSSVRTITHLAVNRFGDFIWIDVEADAFFPQFDPSGFDVVEREAHGDAPLPFEFVTLVRRTAAVRPAVTIG